MTFPKVELRRWERYFTARNAGFGVSESARKARLSESSANRFERGDQRSSGHEAALLLGVDLVGGQLVLAPLSGEASRALDDFGYFRFRYFGRVSMPWQVRAGQDVLGALTDKTRRSFVVINAPPGSGKSTLFTHDIPCWMIARNRKVRMMIGAQAERIARQYVDRIKTSLERESPMLADPDEVDAGIAFDAQATLLDDFGVFKPEGRSQLWRQESLSVRQLDGSKPDDKEPTVTAWGSDSGFLGSRVDLALWDDLITLENWTTVAAKERLRRWLGAEAETRIEPGGAFILQGQRIAHDDLYHVALEKKRLDRSAKYAHVMYRAHDEENCRGHDDDATNVPPAWPDGCLLDPHRLPYDYLTEVANDDPNIYAVQYQQEDGEEKAGLLEMAWILGGVDSHGYPSPGCLDPGRNIGEVPPHLTDGRGWSFVTVDPSPTQWWAVQWWLFDPVTDERYLLDTEKKRMGPEDFLSYDLEHGTHGFTVFGGLLEMWRHRANASRAPLQLVVFERNGAQEWFLRQRHVQQWQDATNIRIVGHVTHANKADPKFGLESIGDLFRQGKIRLPDSSPTARLKVDALIKEAKAYTGADRNEVSDQLMACWFHKLAVENHYSPARAWYPNRTPDFLSGYDRGLAAYR